jgi:DNA-binding CsgD family transcriptional regulator
MTSKDAISVIEAAYRMERGPDWLRSVASATANALEFDPAVLAVRYDASQPEWVHLKQVELLGVTEEFAQTLLHRPDDSPTAIAQVLRTPRVCSILSEPAGRALYERDFRELGMGDPFAINAADPTGHGCMFIFPDPGRSHTPGRLHTLRCLAAHIAAGNRLRRVLADMAEGKSEASARAEAVLTPDGRVEHAVGAAAERAAREALRGALARIDCARSQRQSSERAVELWRGLVEGRWSIVESFERDGKRYYLAHRNDPDLAPDLALTERERQVLAYADLGQSNKLIAYSLGLSTSTVSTLLSRARRKLGIEGSLPLGQPLALAD